VTGVSRHWLIYDDVPPSMNTNAIRSNWRGFHKHKKHWQGLLGMLLLKEQVPRGATHVRANAALQFKVRRKRDEGNFRVLIEKALGDALQEVGVIADDTPEFYEFGTVALLDEDVNRTTIVIEVTRQS
jgi:hypothetical protein